MAEVSDIVQSCEEHGTLETFYACESLPRLKDIAKVVRQINLSSTLITETTDYNYLSGLVVLQLQYN